jgi:hypothetical protein
MNVGLTERCAKCHHSFSFHGKGTKPCQAIGCHAGPADGRCPKFVRESVAARKRRLALSAA